MSLLDRYIAKQFFTNVVLLFVVLFGFVITIDVSLNIDRFVERATDLASSGTAEPGAMRVSVLTAFLVADLWWPRILQLFNFMLGLVLVGAMGFTCAQLVRHREIVAALAGGMSLRRLGRPIIIVALAMSALQVINQELFIPRIAPLLTRDQGDAGEHRLGTTRVPLAADSLGRVWYATSLDAENNVLTDLSIWERASDGQPARRIRADAAVWRDGAWALTGGRAESRLATGPLVEPMERLETDLDPTELRMRRFAGYSQSLSWRQLGELVRNLDRLDADTDQAEAARRRYEQIRWGRVSVIATNVLTLTIALPFFLTRTPGNVLNQSLRAAPLAMGGLLAGVMASSASPPGIPPQLGVFLPVLILAPIAAASLSTWRT